MNSKTSSGFVPDCNHENKNCRGNSITNEMNGGCFAGQGNWVYFTPDNKCLYKMPLDNSENEAICLFSGEEYISSINVSGDWVYFCKKSGKADTGYTIYRTRTDGTLLETLVNNLASQGFYLIDDFLYFTQGFSKNASGVECLFCKFNLKTRETKTIITPNSFPAGNKHASAASYPIGIDYDGRIIYYCSIDISHTCYFCFDLDGNLKEEAFAYDGEIASPLENHRWDDLIDFKYTEKISGKHFRKLSELRSGFCIHEDTVFAYDGNNFVEIAPSEPGGELKATIINSDPVYSIYAFAGCLFYQTENHRWHIINRHNSARIDLNEWLDKNIKTP